jgi:hypothetical protein
VFATAKALPSVILEQKVIGKTAFCRTLGKEKTPALDKGFSFFFKFFVESRLGWHLAKFFIF